jgi:membrane-bound lytic murein transglycosylase D
MHIRLLVLLLLLVVGACAPKADVVKKVGLDDLEAVDKVLTERWPDVPDSVVLTKAEQQALETKLSFPYQLDDYSARMIKKEFVFLNRQIRDTVDRWIRRSEPYLPYIKKILVERGLPEELACLPYIESGFSIKAYSPAGASGLWQFIPGTGRRYGLRSNSWVDERLHFVKATQAAADYLSMLHGMFNEWPFALAGYNAGEGKIQDGIVQIGAKNFFALAQRNDELVGRARLRTETLEYVPRLIAMAKLFKNLKALGFEPPREDRALALVAIDVRPGIDLHGLSEALGVDWEAFHLYNLSFRRNVTPPGETSSVHVPEQMVAKAQEYIEKQPALTKVFAAAMEDEERPSSYVVKKGDNWARISTKTDVPVAKLKELNKRASLKPGTKLRLPGKKSSSKSAHADASHGKPSAQERTSAGAVEKASSGGHYVVQKGDTPGGIAKKFNTSTDALLKANNIKSAKDLRAGQTLVVPGGAQRHEEPARAPEPVRKAEPTKKEEPGKKNEPIKSAPPVRASEPVAPAPKKTDAIATAPKKAEPVATAPKKAEPVATAAKKAEPVAPAPKKAEPVAPKTKAETPSKPEAAKKAEPSKKKIVYLIKSGETVSAIAKRFNVSSSDVLKWNNLTPTSVLKPGDKLNIVTE